VTAIQDGLFWPVTMACGLLPSGLAGFTVLSSLLTQYRWLASAVSPR